MARPDEGRLIAVTGCAYVGSAGDSLEEAFARCLSGEAQAEWMEVRAGRRIYQAPVLRAADPDPRRKHRLDRSVRFGLKAARGALTEAGLETADAVFAGTSRGPLERLSRSVREERFPPGDGPAGVMGCLSGAIAAELGIAGTAVTVSASCTSSAAAIVLGAQHLLGGEASSVLVGGAEAPLQAAALGPLATAGLLGGGEIAGRACRPFDQTRDGTIIGEGAAFLVLETLKAARARGATVKALLAGWALGTEPETRVGQEESGSHFSTMIASALSRAELEPSELGYLNLHGTGTPLNDRAEAAALAGVFSTAVPCSSTKAVLGHCLGAASAMEALIALEALKSGQMPPSTNCIRRDPCAPPGLLDQGPQRLPRRSVASLSSGFWGTHAALIFVSLRKLTLRDSCYLNRGRSPRSRLCCMCRSSISNPRFPVETAAVLCALLLSPAAAQSGDLIPPFVAAAVGLEAKKDVPYVEGGGRRQQLDICYATRGKARPLIVWIHGGGWKSGSKDRNPALPLVAEGYAVASINYRLTGEAPWPAQIEDCKAAIRFLRANAERFRIDPDRIGVWGGSAGGHLAAMLGTAGDVDLFTTSSHRSYSSRVQAVCDWFGPTSFDSVPSKLTQPDRSHSGRQMVAALLGGTPEVKVAAARSASPLTYATPDDPPFLIMHGENDEMVPLSQSRLLEDSLKSVGVPVKLKVVKRAGHAGREWSQRDILKQVRSFFDRTLKG